MKPIRHELKSKNKFQNDHLTLKIRHWVLSFLSFFFKRLQKNNRYREKKQNLKKFLRENGGETVISEIFSSRIRNV